MVDGFHWTRVTSKQLRFLYEAVTLTPAPPAMYELAAKIDQSLAAKIDSSPARAPDGAASSEPGRNRR
jgi:hypothetical protein